ncbi:MAG TPA: DegQ family serine endoprotease, partial [Verrucomicrobiae bacterium]|jgi:serine protease Do|nr:DegQ family serine endoprotease [Verrucomicrobiae bacterium]
VVKVLSTWKGKEMGDTGMGQQGNPFDDPIFRRFFGDQAPDQFDGRGGHNGRLKKTPAPKQQGLGSGVLVSKDGYILTNNHVVENADEVKVQVGDEGDEYPAKVVGTDPKSDLAVLKIDAKDKSFPAITFADSSKLSVGDVVLAVGNPFGIGQTVTMGIVSATGRATLGLEYEDFIQTDAAINMGNSGGALADAEGRLVGINTAILSRSGGNQGIGFAVPVNLAKYVMDSLIENGHVIRGYMGVNIQDITPGLAEKFGIEEHKGALVAEVSPDSPAQKAGLKNGDVIEEFDGKPVHDSRHLKLQVAQTAPGKEVPVKISREGKTKELEVTLKEFPNDKQLAKNGSDKADTGDVTDGITVDDLSPDARQQYNIPARVKGALVSDVDPNCPGYEAGLRSGDVILEINRKPVKNAQDAVQMTENIKDDVLLRVYSHGGSRFVVLKKSNEKVG